MAEPLLLRHGHQSIVLGTAIGAIDVVDPPPRPEWLDRVGGTAGHQYYEAFVPFSPAFIVYVRADGVFAEAVAGADLLCADSAPREDWGSPARAAWVEAVLSVDTSRVIPSSAGASWMTLVQSAAQATSSA